ncbi:MAG: amidase [Chloroflexi bacterium]|nr:amidase [Chloroflexota bacterium]
MAADDLCFLTATELARRMRAKELSAREVVAAHIARVEAVNPAVNAIVTFVPEQAMAAAAAADDALARGEPAGILHGLPVAHKDLVQTKGIRTTLGSPIFRDWVPEEDALVVERLKAAGAITIGKTNTPEFGAGSQTFNPVFGATRNPYDLTKTCGGSSGGAAVALACGMQPIADGSDFGGSLRNPAGYCNVVGFRPTLGRVPRYPLATAFTEMGVEGPMARTVADVALALAAMAGPDPRDPRSLESPGELFLRPLERDFRGVRVAWSRDLGGLPVEPAVTAVLEQQRATFEALGCEVEDASPGLSGADEAFQVIRAWSMAAARRPLLAAHRHEMKDTVIWNVEKGLALTGPEVGEAEMLRTQVFQRMRSFMERYEFLLCPVSQVPPFDIATEYPMVVNGQPMATYIDWMKSCSRVTVTAHPAISVPAGFTADGLPVGLQVVGRYRDDFGVLQLAHAFEAATGFWRRRPAAG